uniref:hypothetical protein n=1 Tax=uncultured Christiangramia sp. TaxID=503836 RepID=UPI002602D3F0|nr:hypothetical protein [uncultured Christiangramia sp.]
MITIKPPILSVENSVIRISAELLFPDRSECLWYEFPQKFESYISEKLADSFLIGILPLALKEGHDITVSTAISLKLFYTVRKYLVPALCLANPEFKNIKITTEKTSGLDLNEGKKAGMGLSCGIDSFATFYSHLDEIAPFKIEYFTFVNAGSLGDHGGQHTRELFYSKLKQVRKFADSVNVEVIPIDSNISELLQMNFQSTHTFRNLSCILNLQKLFKIYYYASPHRFDQFSLNKTDSGDYDLLNTQFLSTNSLTFFSSVANLNRIERTELISHFSSTYNHLDVCTNSRNSGGFVNCTRCDKCLRTALTLDILGKLELYKHVFNLKIYKQEKTKYIGKILAQHNNEFNKELVLYLKQSNDWSSKYRVAYLKYKMKKYKSEIRKFVKSKKS